MKSPTSLSVIQLLSLLLLVAPISDNIRAHASILTVESESAVFDSLNNRVDFTIQFSRVPDFFTVDAFGRQADAFQYWIFYDNNPSQPTAVPFLDALIRGGEIYVSGDLPIRLASPPAVGDPDFGGWGVVTDRVAFSLFGTTLSFSAEVPAIGDSDGEFAYRLQTFEFGATRDTVFGGTAGPYDISDVVPEPAPIILWSGIIICAAVGIWLHKLIGCAF